MLLVASPDDADIVDARDVGSCVSRADLRGLTSCSTSSSVPNPLSELIGGLFEGVHDDDTRAMHV